MEASVQATHILGDFNCGDQAIAFDSYLQFFMDVICLSQANFTIMNWTPYAQVYDPLKVGSIDGTDPDPHDRAIIRALDSEYEPDKNVKGKPDHTIFIARLYRQTKEDTIMEEFSKYGHIRRFRLVRDIVTGHSKGYAFIEYEKKDAANQAYNRANNMFIDGRRIFVDFECERILPGWKPRRLGGGFGGKKESGQLRFGGRDRPFRKPLPVPSMKRKMHEEEDKKYEERRKSASKYKKQY